MVLGPLSTVSDQAVSFPGHLAQFEPLPVVPKKSSLLTELFSLH